MKGKDNFKNLYDSNYQRAFMLVKRYVHDEIEAEDIVSDVMIKLWQTIQTTALESVDAMLYTMLRNASLNYLKHKQIEMEALVSVSDLMQRELAIRISALEDSTPSLTLLNEIHKIVHSTLSKLPPLTKEIFTLSRFENKTNKEIADICSVSIKTVEYHIAKTISVLRKVLKDYLPLAFLPFILFLF